MKKEYKKEVKISVEVEGRLIEERWYKKLEVKKYEKLIDFIYKYFTQDN